MIHCCVELALVMFGNNWTAFELLWKFKCRKIYIEWFIHEFLWFVVSCVISVTWAIIKALFEWQEKIVLHLNFHNNSNWSLIIAKHHQFHKQCFNVDMMWKDMLEKKRIVPINWLNLGEFRWCIKLSFVIFDSIDSIA